MLLDIFFMNQNTLETLIIERLNNQSLSSVCKHLKRLKHLELCHSVNDSLANINDLTNIEVLQLHFWNQISADLLCEVFKVKKLMLRELKLSHPITIKIIMSESCPNLEDLHLKFCKQIPKNSAQMIFKN